MKIHYKKLEFAIVFLLLVMPPVFTTSDQNSTISFAFSYVIFIQAAIAILLDIQYRKTALINKNSSESPAKKTYDLSYRIKIFSQEAITFGLLFLVYAIFQTAAFLIPSLQKSGINTQVVSPSGASEILTCILSVIIAAYYEEVLYRQYLPSSIYEFFYDGNKISLLIETFPILFFAASHLYLGWLGVVNALLCGFILRRCAVKTGSIYTGTFVHILYNLIMYLVIA